MGAAGIYCTMCGRHTDECGRLSTRGRCAECGDTVQLANVHSLRDHHGPFFEHWAIRLAEGVSAAVARSRDGDEAAA